MQIISLIVNLYSRTWEMENQLGFSGQKNFRYEEQLVDRGSSFATKKKRKF